MSLPTPAAESRRAPAAPTARLSKSEQSAGTRRRIVLAAVECLAELGFSGTTLQVIAERIGMSRTPMYYHFSTRLDLFVEVAKQLPTLRAQSYSENLLALPTMKQRLKALVASARAGNIHPEHLAAIELKLAARGDPALRVQLLPVIEAAERRGETWWIDGLSGRQDGGAKAIAFRQVVLGLVRSTVIDESIGLTPDPEPAWGLIDQMVDTLPDE